MLEVWLTCAFRAIEALYNSAEQLASGQIMLVWERKHQQDEAAANKSPRSTPQASQDDLQSSDMVSPRDKTSPTARVHMMWYAIFSGLTGALHHANMDVRTE